MFICQDVRTQTATTRLQQAATHRLVHPALSPVLPGLLDVGLSLLVGKPLPDLGDLLESVGPQRVGLLELRVVLVGVEDLGDRGLVSELLVALVLEKRGPASARGRCARPTTGSTLRSDCRSAWGAWRSWRRRCLSRADWPGTDGRWLLACIS